LAVLDNSPTPAFSGPDRAIVANNKPLDGLPLIEEPFLSLADVHCAEKLGGLLKHYNRRAA
jgi:hypothetical protein